MGRHCVVPVDVFDIGGRPGSSGSMPRSVQTPRISELPGHDDLGRTRIVLCTICVIQTFAGPATANRRRPRFRSGRQRRLARQPGVRERHVRGIGGDGWDALAAALRSWGSTSIVRTPTGIDQPASCGSSIGSARPRRGQRNASGRPPASAGSSAPDRLPAPPRWRRRTSWSRSPR